MTDRLDDIDCVSARGHAALGGTLAIQAVWHYDRAVDTATLTRFHAALCAGKLARTVAHSIIPAAGDRWSARTRFAPLRTTTTPLPAADLEAWILEQARAPLQTFGGPTWRLSSANFDDGRSAVSLLVSHTVTDGGALCAAIAAAVADERVQLRFPSDEYGPFRLVCSDIRATARRGTRLWLAAILAVRLLLHAPRRRTARHDVEPDRGAGVPTIAATIPAPQWHEAAQTRNGTAATLAVAVLASIATEIGRVNEHDRVEMMMPVATRAADDARANALTSIDFEIARTDELSTDLSALRAAIKAKLTAAGAGANAVPPLIPVAVALPRSLHGMLARQVAADPVRTVCSYLGELDPQVLRIDGAPATAIMLGLVDQSLDSRRVLAERGGTLYALFNASVGSITLRINGFQAPALTDTDQLADVVSRVLARYGLSATFW
ncbi:hypothetical protein [Nocardia callitridis]|uniref:Diacylglycerol O-acyltransferase n=1 Tax=Nocardia callitridis TaxID=648753 RepID=A0ABP9KNP7_9NOCA